MKDNTPTSADALRVGDEVPSSVRAAALRSPCMEPSVDPKKRCIRGKGHSGQHIATSGPLWKVVASHVWLSEQTGAAPQVDRALRKPSAALLSEVARSKEVPPVAPKVKAPRRKGRLFSFLDNDDLFW